MRSSLYINLFLMILVTACLPAIQSPIATSSLVSTSTSVLSNTLTPTPTITPPAYPTLGLTLTSTPQPTLIEHEWQPERVLLLFEFTRGDGGGTIMPPNLPSFILYVDGSLFTTHSMGDKFNFKEQLYFKKLGRKEICQNLNTLDQIGFLDYDPSDYKFIGIGPNVQGAGGANIQVNTWKSHSNEYYELPLYMREELTGDIVSSLYDKNNRDGFPIISTALRNAYYFFTQYPLQGFEIYRPEKLAVWIQPLNSTSIDYVESEGLGKEWTLRKSSLADMFAKIGFDDNYSNDRYLVLIGEEARAVYNFFGESYSTDYYYKLNSLGEKEYYILHARPLLPYELPGGYDSQIPAPNSTRPNYELTCYPSDGILPIPSPDLILNFP